MNAIDAVWFDKLTKSIKRIDDFEMLTKSLQVNLLEKERFLEDEVENPEFKYYYKDDKFEKVSNYEELVKEIETEEKNDTVKELYLDKVGAQVTRLKMMQASQVHDDKEFYRLSSALYGKPKMSYFAYIAKRLTERSEQNDVAWKESSAKRIHKLLSKIDTSKVTYSNDVLPEIFHEKNERSLSPKAVKQIFSAVLEQYKIAGWRVIIDTTENRRRFSVLPGSKEIYIPSSGNLVDRSLPLTRLRAEAIAQHEVGVHVRRASEGAKQPLQLLALGLPGYLRGEEGIASYVQQQIEGAEEYYGFDRYLAASVAVGLDGEPRDFRAVYSIMYDYFVLTSTEDSLDKDRVISAAWDSTLRVFRGTSAHTPGCIFTRDLAYLEGNIGVWQLMVDKPQVFDSLFIGKFDPLNKKHVTALQSLGILSEW